MRLPGLSLWLLLAVLVGGALLVDRLVETDAEAVEAVIERATTAVQEGDFGALRGFLAEAYRGEGGDAGGAVRRAQQVWQTFRPVGLATNVLEVTVEGDTARAPVKVKGAVLGRPVVLGLDLGFVREAGGWKVASAVVSGVGERVGWPL